MNIEIEELRKAHGNGRWGFQTTFVQPAGFGVQQNPPQPLVTIDTPSWMARPWTVTLGSFRYASGGLVPPPPVQGADAQTCCFAQVRCDWGVDGATESAVIDYPWGGCTFQVHAANIKLYYVASLGGPFNFACPPLLQGWVSPQGQGRGATEALGPTFTATTFPGPGLATSGGTTVVNVPKRAIAYRIVYVGDPAFANFDLQQVCGGGAVSGNIATDAKNENLAQLGLYQERSTFVPLLPFVSLIRITNNNASLALQWTMQFLLDLG